MSIKTVVFCLEEDSAKCMLSVLLPRILSSEICCQFIVFEGKQDLLKRIAMRIQGWQKPNSRFLVLCDQDADDCRRLKQHILNVINENSRKIKIRVACHELENFYLGDLNAVEKGLGCNVRQLESKAIFRNPDVISNAPQMLKKISRNSYQKCLGSKKIASFLDISGGNKSYSFNVLLAAIKELTSD